MRVLLLLLSLLPTFAEGDIYKYVNPNGTVEYSDQPRKGAAEVEVTPLQTYTLPSPPNKIDPPHEGKSQPVASSYQVAIVKPQENATIRENTGKVKVVLRVNPALEADSNHTLQLLLDGQSVGKLGSSTEYLLTNVDRGTHRLQARLLNPAGNPVARSKSVTFHMRRISILFRSPDDGNGQPGGVQQAPRAPQMPKMPGPPSPGGIAFP